MASPVPPCHGSCGGRGASASTSSSWKQEQSWLDETIRQSAKNREDECCLCAEAAAWIASAGSDHLKVWWCRCIASRRPKAHFMLQRPPGGPTDLPICACASLLSLALNVSSDDNNWIICSCEWSSESCGPKLSFLARFTVALSLTFLFRTLLASCSICSCKRWGPNAQPNMAWWIFSTKAEPVTLTEEHLPFSSSRRVHQEELESAKCR